MPRIRPLEPAEAPEASRELLEGPLRLQRFNAVRSLAASPAALEMFLSMNAALGRAALGPVERQVVLLAISEANGSAYCVAAHAALGLTVGLTGEGAAEARRGRGPDPTLAALAAFALAVHEQRGRVSDADVARFRGAGFGDAHIAEVVALHALATFTNTFNLVNGTEPDFPAVTRV